MRMSRKAGLLISTAVCGALALGTAGTAFASIDDAPARSERVSAPDAPLPDADALLAQTKSLDNLSVVLAPVTDLLNDVLKADAGKLTPAQVTQHTDAVKKAIAAAQQAKPAAPPVPPVSQPDNGTKARTHQAAADVKADALADVQAKVDALLKAAASGDATTITNAVTATITAAVNVLVSVTLGSGLPAPNLPGLPALPALPGA